MLTPNLYYTGVGSRETPKAILKRMEELAEALALAGYILRSGAADGADTAFETGAKQAHGTSEIWLPWKGFNDHSDTGFYPSQDFFELAAAVHPRWSSLTRGPRALHARNCGQVLGANLKTPSSFVICWTPDGCESEAERQFGTGGTATAIVLADRNHIPVFNLARGDAEDRLYAFLSGNPGRYHKDMTLPKGGAVLVYGSNLAGRHGAGAALAALEQFGALYGQGEGRQGDSYAIPTKDGRPGTPDLKDPASVLALAQIGESVRRFLAYAKSNPCETFFVTRIGCGRAALPDATMAVLFRGAPANCSFPEEWKQALESVDLPSSSFIDTGVAPGINISSNSKGLGGGLTNPTEMARAKGNIKHSYPIKVNDVLFEDAEAAYQALKHVDDAPYNDGLMIDLICLKFKQHPKLFDLVTDMGGVPWLGRCSHFTGAQAPRAQSWEGTGQSSRFICNLMYGYQKALSGRGPQTRVVHVKEAPFDVYIGRRNGSLPESIWHNPFPIDAQHTREQALAKCYAYIKQNERLLANLESLRGLTLGCWCKTKENPLEACHGDIYVALLNGQSWSMPSPAQGSLF